MKSFIVPMVVFAAIITIVLLGGATANGDTQQVIQQAQPVVQETFGWLPCIIPVVILAVGFLTFLMRGDSTPSVPMNTIIQAIVLNDNDYDPETERDTFTREEMALPGIDITIPKHREYIKGLRRERKATGITEAQQSNRAKHEERVRPDLRDGAYSQEHFSNDEYVSMLNKIFNKARVRFKANIYGGYDLAFEMSGKATLEMEPVNDRGRYRVVQVYWKEGKAHKSSKEVYVGDSIGAIQLIKSWYEGGKEWSAWK